MRTGFGGSGGVGQELGDCYVGQILTVRLAEPAPRPGRLRRPRAYPSRRITTATAATPRGPTSKQGGGRGVNDPLPHPVALPGETPSGAVAVTCAPPPPKPTAHLWAITQQKERGAQRGDASREMKPVSVEDAVLESRHSSPPAFTSLVTPQLKRTQQ